MVQQSYKTPTAFYGALKHKAQLLANDSMSVADIMSSYYFSRLVARVFHAQPDRWVLKGGHALLMRYATAARLSQDIDIQHAGGDIGEAVSALLSAASHDLSDYLRFEPKRLSTHQNGSDGAKQLFHVYLGNHHVNVLRVDVVVGHQPTSVPDSRLIQPLVDLNWPAYWPEVKLYPIVSHLADKVCALFERHKGAPSSRFRDLADILLISQREELDGRYAQIAIRAEARRRMIAGTTLKLPRTFQAPGPAWPARYPAAARQVPGLNGCGDWTQAAIAADAFLTPLLAPDPPGHWRPADAGWYARTQPITPPQADGHAERPHTIEAEARTRHPSAPASPATRHPHPDVPPPPGAAATPHR